MRAEKKISFLLTIPLIGVIALLSWWLTYDPTHLFEIRSPGMDNRQNAGEIAEEINIGTFFERFSDNIVTPSESWPRFRGADLDNIYKSKIRLVDKFGASGPKIMWTKDLGEGHAGPAVYKGSVYLLDYDEEKKAEMLRCIELKTGEEIWRRWYYLNMKRNHGMSRTVPAVSDQYILTLGPKCQVMCMDRETGHLLWSLDIVREYGAEIPFWYTGQCPLLDGDEAVLATGGKALIIGVNGQSGEVTWETPNESGWKMSHSSIIPFEFAGVKMYVYSAIGGVVGISAQGERKGEILWQTSAWNHQVVAPSPLCLPDGKIFLAAGYGAGSMLLQLQEDNGSFSVDVISEYDTKDGLSSEQQTPIYYNGYIYSILPKDAGSSRNQFVCVNPENFNRFVWSSGPTSRFGLGPYIIADNKFYILDNEAVLTIAQVSPKQYIQLDQHQLFDGQDSWGPFALADGFLILRDSKKMMCIDLRA